MKSWVDVMIDISKNKTVSPCLVLCPQSSDVALIQSRHPDGIRQSGEL